jgi:FkbM family methyltransferase
MVRAALDYLHQVLGRSEIATRLAVLFRNQCQGIIKYHLGESPNASGNGEEWLIRLVAPSARTFVDVGANVGAWSKRFTEHMAAGCKGLLFEPSASASARLVETFKAQPGIQVVASALSDSPGETTFWEEPDSGETSSLVQGFSNPKAIGRTVRVTTLDRELAAREWSHVSFVKIDAEGFDLHVLRGAAQALRSQTIEMLQFEYNAPWAAAGSTLGEAYRLLAACDYEIFLLKSTGLYTLNYDRYGEYYRYSNFVAASPSGQTRLRDAVRGVI